MINFLERVKEAQIRTSSMDVTPRHRRGPTVKNTPLFVTCDCIQMVLKMGYRMLWSKSGNKISAGEISGMLLFYAMYEDVKLGAVCCFSFLSNCRKIFELESKEQLQMLLLLLKKVKIVQYMKMFLT